MSPVLEYRPIDRRKKDSMYLAHFRKSVMSQFGQDGVFEKIFDIIGVTTKWCVEFGAWDGLEGSNTWNLIHNKQWSAVQIEGHPGRFKKLLENHQAHKSVFPFNKWISPSGPDSLDNTLRETPIPKAFDLLCIDIDSNDWSVWNSLTHYEPRVVCIEFNPTIPLDVYYVQDVSGGQRAGCSLLALVELGKKKGYELVSAFAVDAIFVKSEYFPLFNIADNSIEAMYSPSETKLFQTYDGGFQIVGLKTTVWSKRPFEAVDVVKLSGAANGDAVEITHSSSHPLPNPVEALIDVGRGKSAWQSSYYPNLPYAEYNARKALSGIKTGYMSFSTDREDHPWWVVDLGEIFNIFSLLIYNREDAATERADSLQVQFSSDGINWNVVVERTGRFGGVKSKVPFFAYCEGRAARFIRLMLNEHNPLHLDSVEVYVRSTDLASIADCPTPDRSPLLRIFSQRHGISYEHVFGEKRGGNLDPYFLSSEDPIALDGSIAALRIVPFGRFGNNLHQLLNAIFLARRLGVPAIVASEHDLFCYSSPVSDGQVTIYPPKSPISGLVLEGGFFHMPVTFPTHAPHFQPEEKIEIVERFIKPILPTALFEDHGVTPRDLVIHIRGGDVFTRPPETQTGYTPPPLAFYQAAVAHAMADLGCTRICVVYEDHSNPCVASLERFLVQSGIPHRMQNGSLIDDIAHIIQATNVVLGNSTFGWAIAMLSSSIKYLYNFDQEHFYDDVRQARGLHFFTVKDVVGDYTKRGFWNNASTAHLDLLLSYPVDKLAIVG